jgi:FkbM family methyltransferase
MLQKLRGLVQGALYARGIEVRKAPANGFRALPVFHLAVQALMAERGDALRFVQVGANDGDFGDPLRAYVLARGWTGILIEPQPLVFEALKENYAQCADRLIFENIAISHEPKITLFLPPSNLKRDDGGVHARSVVSGDAGVIARQIGVSKDALEKIEVPALTLDALLAKHAMAEVDVLQIDAEGFDWAVLETLDLAKVAPMIIQLETGHLSRATQAKMVRHLEAHRYDIYWGGHEGDAVAVRSGFVKRT